MNNDDLNIGAIGTTTGIVTHAFGADIVITLFIAFLSGFVSIAGKHFFIHLKNKKNEE
jgi:hypothetical protein